MSTDTQAPEAKTPSPVSDPDAPFGRRPNGVPYKRDPSAFAHLRGKAFGSMNGNSPSKRGDPKPARAKVTSDAPLSTDAKGYGQKFKRGFQALAKLTSKRAPVPAAILAVRSADMADAWGRVAVTYPKFGRVVDKLGKTGDLGDAIGGTVLTLALIAHAQGFTRGTPIGELLEGYVMEALLEFDQSPEFAGMRKRMEDHAAGVVVEDQGDAANVDGE